MRKNNVLFKRMFSSFMAVVIAFTTASYDVSAAGLTTGGMPGYEYDEMAEYGDISDNGQSADVSDNGTALDVSSDELTFDISDNEYSSDVSGTESATDINSSESNVIDGSEISEKDGLVNDSETTTEDDVSAGDIADSESDESIIPEWFVPGYIENPFDEPAEEITKRQGLLREAPLESQYIPSDIQVSLRNQNPYGTCWAFASTALAELYMNKHYGLIPDYSELHLAYSCYRPIIDPLGGTDGDIADSSWDFLNGGGNAENAAFTFASWRGVATERSVPYSRASSVRANGIDADLIYEDAIHLRNFYEINIHKNPEIVKKLVKENGGVAISYYSLSGTSDSTSAQYYNSANNCYYYPTATAGNHAVTIVGWDDNFSKSNFSQTPKADGAWLIRNSWTTGSYANNQSYSGYFWMSYYDKTISDDAYSFTFDDAEQYDNNYQYDGIPLNTWYSYGSKTITIANVFTAKACSAGEELQAVAFHTASSNFTAEIKIYNPNNNKKPDSGTLLATQTFSSDYPGYHTVDLINPVMLEPNQKFSVVIKLTAKESPKVSIEFGGFYGYTTHADAGESFVSFNNGSTWTDYGSQHNANLRIKAFTQNAVDGIDVESIEFKNNISSTGISLGLFDEYDVKAVTRPYRLNSSKLIWTSSDENVATVSESGCIKAVGMGTAVITATAPSGAGCSVTVSVETIPKIRLSYEGNSTFERGMTRQYKVQTYPGELDITDKVTFSVSDTSVISVDESGIVTAIKPGTATLYAQFLTKTESNYIRVVAVRPDPTISVSRDNTVTVTWPSTGADEYKIDFYDGSGRRAIPIPAVPGQEVYSYTDTAYKDTTKKKDIGYYVRAGEYDISNRLDWSTTLIRSVVGPAYDITYVLNGGTNNPNNPEYIREGGNNVLYEPTPPRGYIFSGWYTSPDFELDTLAIYLNEAHPYTVYAKYNPIEYYVQFDPNGANSGQTYGYTLKYDKAWTIPLNGNTFNLARTGWIFNGWNTRADGSGTYYADGAAIKNLTAENGDTVWLFAQWTPIRYNVTFDATGGTVEDTVKKLAHNEQYGTLPEPVRDGYDFAGWYTAASGGSRITETSLFTVQKNQTLYAHWTPKSYTLTFEDPHGHNVIDSRSVTYTSTYGTLPSPTRKGYIFDGWYLGDSKIVATSKVDTIGNHTLTAHWTPKSFKVTFNGNGGTVSLVSITAEYDGRYDKNGALPVATRPNYTFAGWYTEASGGDMITGSSIVNKDTNHTLYAHWKGVESVVSFDLMCDESELKALSPEITDIKVEYLKTYGEAVNTDNTPAGGLKAPERTGYTFVGWYMSPDYLTRVSDATVVNVTADSTLYARWEPVLVDVTFVPDNGEDSFTKSFVYGGIYELPEAPLKRGYSFAGWYTKAYDDEHPEDRGELKDESATITDPDAHTLYGHWNANKYVISFIDEDDTQISAIEVSFDAPITDAFPTPEKEGYILEGWALVDDSTDIIDIGQLKLKYDYDRNITLRARFIPRTDIVINFDSAGGTITLPEEPWKVTYKTPYAGGLTALPIPVKEHFEFAGWFTKPEGEDGAVRVYDDSIVNIASDHTLYAHWALMQYKVIFKLEGGNFYKKVNGTGAAAALENVSYKVAYNTTPDIEVPEPVRPKFSFAGWYDAPEGGAPYDFSAPITGETYIYAHWVQMAEDVDIDGAGYRVAEPEVIIHRQQGDGSTGFIFADTARIELKSATPGAKIYFIINPDDEEKSADYSAYLKDKDKQDRLTLYTDELNPNYLLTSGSREICIRAIAVKDGYAASNAVMFELTLTDSSEEWGDITDEDRTGRFGNNITAVPQGMWISGIPENVIFTGSNITFADLKVYDAKRLMTPGTDYTVAYKNNKNVGKATVTVTGKGNYAGTFTQTFTISPKNLADADINAKAIRLAYTGKVQMSAPAITYGTAALKSGTDFTVFYPHTNAKEKEGANAYNADAFKVPGDYEVTVTGKGNYTGTLTYTETILESGAKPVTALTVSVSPAKQAYTGAPVEPAVTVKNGSSVLKGIKAADYEALSNDEKAEYHYTYEYFDNIAVGKARILIKGVDSLYDGEREVSFDIIGTNISTAKLSGVNAAYQYNGLEILPAVGGEGEINLYYDATKTSPRKDLVYDAANPDSEDNDYFVTYNSNVKAAGSGSAVGKAAIVFTGNPNKGYTGTKTVTYTITAVNLANDAKSGSPLIIVRDGDSEADFANPAAHAYPYTKGGVTPKPEVSFVRGDGTKTVLKEGVDYTLSYLNNTAVNGGTNAGKLPTVRITGKGNFTGMRAVDYFSIIPSGLADKNLALSGVKMTAADVSFANKKNNYLTTVVITDVNGKNLAAGTDYDKNFEYRLAEEIRFSDGKVYPAGYVLTKNDTVPAGARIKVTAAAKGSYAGYISAEYRVVGADISKATVTVAAQYYTGYEIRPGKSKLNVVVNKVSLSPEDYEITGYDNNINKGTGHIYIKGVGNYGGVKTVNFNIVTKPMGYTVVFNGNGSTSGSMAAQTIAAGRQAALTANRFVRTGFTFAGWSTEPNGTGNTYTDKEIVSNPGTESAIVLNLYAIWVPTEYTITYHMGGGINNPLNKDYPSENAKAKYGRRSDGTLYYTAATATFKLEAPLREDWPTGYQFEGFYKENTYKTRIAAISRGTTGNIDLYAKWVPYNYTVSFDGNGAEKGTVDSETFSYGIAKAVNANKFTRTGHVFMGWALDKAHADAGIAVISDKASVDERAFNLAPRNNENGRVTLYAVWRNVFTVEFAAGGGVLPATTETDTGLTSVADIQGSGSLYEYTYGTQYKLPTPVREGYAFGGWFTDEALKVKLASIAGNKSGDIVLYAKWTPYKYTVTFNGNGSNGGKTAAKSLNCGTPGTLTVNGFTKKGFKFERWNTAADGSGTDYEDGDVINIVPAKNSQTVTLYAQWTPVEYKIKYVRNGGSLNSEYPNYITTYEYNYAAPGDKKGGYELPIPSRKGFTFLGWYKESTFRTKVARINKTDFGDMTLYAKWGMKYKVSFDANAFYGGTGTMAAQTCSYETATALRSNSFKNTSGKVFMGWAVSASRAASGTVAFTNAQKLLTPDMSVMTYNDATGMYEMTLYAVWKDKFTAEFVLNGGTLPSRLTIESDNKLTYLGDNLYEYTYGAAYTLPTPSLDGCTFAGWYEDSAFKEKVTNISKTTSGDKVLYAKYTGKKYTVKFDSDAPVEISGVSKRKVTGSMGTQSFVYMTPAKLKACGFKITGYTFLGWSTKDYTTRVEEYAEANDEDIATARLAYDLDPSADVEYTNAESVEDILRYGETALAYESEYVLYAVWQKNVYVITYQNMGGIPNSNSITYTVDDEVVLKEPEKMGDTFLGWYSDAKFKSKVVKIAKGSTGNRNLYAKFANNKYTIRYVLNDADGPAAILDSSHVGYITTYDLSADSGYILASASREGYDFAGWYTDAKLTKAAGPVIAPPSVDMTVYAKWIKK